MVRQRRSTKTLACHADLDLVTGQHLDEVGGGELAALVRIEDFRLSMTRHGFLDGFDARYSASSEMDTFAASTRR